MNDPARALPSCLAALGSVSAVELGEARVVLHWALQPVSAFGSTMVPARDDYGHTALHWDRETRRLRSEVHAETGLLASVDPERLELMLQRGEQVLERRSLPGIGLSDAYQWLEQALAGAGHPVADGITRPDHEDDLPAHAVADGGVFSAPPPEHLAELARWLDVADALMHRARAEISEMGAGACWPHHFDTAALHVLSGEGEDVRSVGVGLSMGDEGYPEPYVYVTPWPYPDDARPDLPRGHWHTEGWTGAVLRGSELLRVEPEERAAALLEMVRVAHHHGVQWLRARPGA